MKEILLALLAAALTSVGTWFIVDHQLSRGNSIWIEQQKSLHEQRLLDEKINVIKEIVVYFTRVDQKRFEYNSTLVRLTLSDELYIYSPNKKREVERDILEKDFMKLEIFLLRITLFLWRTSDMQEYYSMTVLMKKSTKL